MANDDWLAHTGDLSLASILTPSVEPANYQIGFRTLCYRQWMLVLNRQNKKFNLFLAFWAAAAVWMFGCAPVVAQNNASDFFQLQNQPAPPPFPNRNQFVTPAPVQVTPPPARLNPPEIIFYNQPGQPVGNFSPLPNQLPNQTPSPGFNGQPFPFNPAINPGFNAGFDPYQTPQVPTQNSPFPLFPYPNENSSFGSGLQPANPNQAPSFFGNPAANRGQYQGTGSNWLPSIDWNRFQQEFLPRVFERPRARQTYLVGDGTDQQLGMQDIELATTFTFANFLQTNQPLRTTPGFIFHFWDGPNSIANPGFDLPPQAYSVFLAFDHLTNPANRIGLETNFTVGYYSDFDNTSSDGFRFTGRGLVWTRLNSYTVGKLGVEYFDRVDLKLLPSFGVYMTPNADTKLDLLFPQTKLSHRIPNFNDYEAWAYVGGEYGGGSWVIDRAMGGEDQVDINDIRAFVGLEWIGPRRVTGFFEAGYVFNREILYRSNPANALELRDTVMIRSGFAF